MAFGTIMFWEVCHYFIYDWVERYYVQPEFRFTYYSFDWLRLWSGGWIYLLFLGALMIALGVLYRLSMTLFILGFSYVFLFDQSLYLNHFYLICLISLTMIFIPAHRAVSFDARLCPGIRSDTAPAWALGLLAAQVGIAYFYGGPGEAERRLASGRAYADVARQQDRLPGHRALVATSLNGRDPQLLIDPEMNLVIQRRTLAPAEWIVPLEEPLSSGEQSGVERALAPHRAKFSSELRRAADEAEWKQLFRPGKMGPLEENVRRLPDRSSPLPVLR